MPTKTSVGPNEVVRLEVLRLAPPLNRAPLSASAPCPLIIEVLVPGTSRDGDGRAGRVPLAPRRAPGAPKCATRPCNGNVNGNGTQEI